MQSRILQYLSPLVSSVMHACLILGWLSSFFAWALYLCSCCAILGTILGFGSQVYWNLATNGVYLTRCGCATWSTVYISSNHGIHMHFVPRQVDSESIFSLAQRFLQKSWINRHCSVWWSVTGRSSIIIIYQLMLHATTIAFSLNNSEQLDNSWKQLTTECECLVVSIFNCYRK